MALLRFKILGQLLAIVKFLLGVLLVTSVMAVIIITIFETSSTAYAISFNAEVTTSDRPSKLENFEHCSLDPDKLAAIGRDVGQQVRIVRDRENYAIYTVKAKQQEDRENVVRLTPKGLKKLGVSSEPIKATIESQVPYASCLNNVPCISDAQAKMMSEFVERLDDDGTNTSLIIIAPHGGSIEVNSDTVAEKTRRNLETLGKSVSYWRCKGWKEGSGDYRRWHITSTDINEASFPLLATIIKRHFQYAISFHGFKKELLKSNQDKDIDIWIGGLASPSLKRELRDVIIKNAPTLKVKVSNDLEEGDPFPAIDENNIVNRLAKYHKGIQIEMAKEVRENANYRDRIAESVRIFYETKI